MKTRTWLVLLVALALAVGAAVVLYLRRAPPPAPEPPPPPPVVEPRGPALQSDAEGDYLPGYRFSVNRYRFTRFTLRPDPVVTFTAPSTETEYPIFCLEAQIRRDGFHLRCDHDRIGIVTIDGRFLTRVATGRQGTPVVSAVVTVRTQSGETLYSARDSFGWQPAE